MASQTKTQQFERISTERLDRAAGKLLTWISCGLPRFDRSGARRRRVAAYCLPKTRQSVSRRYEAIRAELDRRHHARLAQVRPC